MNLRLFAALCALAVAVPAQAATPDAAALPARPDPAAATFTLAADGRSILLDGDIGRGSAARLRRLLRDAPHAETLVLRSPGGWMGEARRIAAMVRARGLDTIVDGGCMSACTIVLIAGDDRVALPGARVGFHRPRVFGAPRDSRENVGAPRSRAAYVRAGLAAAFVDRVIATPFETMWYPSQAEMVAANVLSREMPTPAADLAAPAPSAPTAHLAD